MYRVEKFFPPGCPACKTPFVTSGVEYALLLGYVETGGRKVPRQTPGYDLVVCMSCTNVSARVVLEVWQVSDLARAKQLLTQGFVNLVKVQASGDDAKDSYEARELSLFLRR